MARLIDQEGDLIALREVQEWVSALAVDLTTLREWAESGQLDEDQRDELICQIQARADDVQAAVNGAWPGIGRFELEDSQAG